MQARYRSWYADDHALSGPDDPDMNGNLSMTVIAALLHQRDGAARPVSTALTGG